MEPIANFKIGRYSKIKDMLNMLIISLNLTLLFNF